MNIPTACPSTVLYDEKILVAGRTMWNDHVKREFDIYDRIAQSWTLLICTLASLKLRVRLCVVDDYIFVMGIEPDNQSTGIKNMKLKSMNKSPF